MSAASLTAGLLIVALVAAACVGATGRLRVGRVRLVAFFVLLVVCVAVVRLSVFGLPSGEAISLALWQSPFLFLGVFMLSEPATLPPRRWQQFTVAAVVAVLAGGPIECGAFTLGQERALLIGNLVGFVWMQHRGLRLTLLGARAVTPTVRELTFSLSRPLRFAAGQYLQLTVPHRHPDARGTRREFSIVSSPLEVGVVRLAYRASAASPDATGPRGLKPLSSFKRALTALAPGAVLSATGVVTLQLFTSQNPTTIPANIALSFPEAYGTNVNVLIATGLILFIVAFAVNAVARYIVSRRKEFSGAN